MTWFFFVTYDLFDFWAIFNSIWCYTGPFWDQNGTKIRSFWDDFGPFSGRSGSFWVDFGRVSGCFDAFFLTVLAGFWAFWEVLSKQKSTEALEPFFEEVT